jgi:hypothetical protein
MVRRTRRVSLSLVCVCLLLVWVGPASSDDVGVLQPHLAPGDVVSDGPVEVIVPGLGQGVWIHAFGPEGSADLGVETDLAGSVSVFALGPDLIAEPLGVHLAASSPELSAPLAACDDDAFRHHRWKVFGPSGWEWSFQSSSTPSELTAAQAEEALIDATDNIVQANNDCSMNDNVSADHIYDGTTPAGDDMEVIVNDQGVRKARCDDLEDTDGLSVSRFGNLPVKAEGAKKNFYGFTCTWFTFEDAAPHRVSESDMRLNKEDFDWTVSISSGCTDEFDVEAAATHERMHTFGVAHVSEARHGDLTASPTINGACQDDESTLGRGDVLGLNERY